MPEDYYTRWSFYAELAILGLVVIFKALEILPTIASTLATAAFANALAVGAIGSLLVYYGDTGIPDEHLHYGNAFFHALPAFVATVLFMAFPDAFCCSKPLCSVGLVLLLSIAYLITPTKDGMICLDKIRLVYGVDCPLKWVVAMALTVAGLIYIIQKRFRRYLTLTPAAMPQRC